MKLYNSRVSVELSTIGEYAGSRFDHLPSVKQITLDNRHTFLGIEKTKNGYGSQGFGLQCGFLWSDEAFAKRVEKEQGVYPLLGVGTLCLPKGEAYHIHGQYETYGPKISITEQSDTEIEMVSLDADIAQIQRTISLEDLNLSIVTEVTNLATSAFRFEEYCHNFIQLDGYEINSHYRCDVSYQPAYTIVRGSILAGEKWYFPVSFEEELGTLALIPQAKQEDATTLVKVSHDKSNTFIACYDDFGPEKTYHWISPWSLCPENYLLCTLEAGQKTRFERRFTIGYLNEH